jgi:hypothetical protein
VRRLAPAVLALLALALAPTAAHAAAGMEVAVQDDSVFVSQSYYKRASALKDAEALNASWLRVNVLWSGVVGKSAKSRSKPKTIKYDFTSYDGVVTAARAKGINVQMSLTGTAPAWATGNKKVGGYKPNAKLYADFVRATVAHFKGFVSRYSIWNEPNHVGWLTPLGSAAKLYRALYKSGYSAVKKADKNAKVLFGELAPFARSKKTATEPLAFLRAVLGVNAQYKGGGVRFTADGFAHHPYDFEHAPDFVPSNGDSVTMSTLGRLTGALDALAANASLRTPGHGALDLWLDEYGYMSHGKHAVPAATHAQYLVRGFEIAQANPRVRQTLQYLLAQPTSKYAFFDTSIMDRKGKRSAAFNTLADWTHKAALDGRITSPFTKPPKKPPPYKDPVR